MRRAFLFMPTDDSPRIPLLRSRLGQASWAILFLLLFLIPGRESVPAVMAASGPPPTPTPLALPAPVQKISMNFRNVDVSVLVRFMSELLQQNIVMDERVKGKLTILSPAEVTVSEAFRIFSSALRMKGFETVSKKGMIYIVPETQAPPTREMFLYTLENTSAKSIAKTVNAILSKGFAPRPVGGVREGGFDGPIQIVADKSSNSLIVSATAHDYERLKPILHSLDAQPGEVYVKASLIEISTDKLNNIQVNLLGGVLGSNNSGVVGLTNYGMLGSIVNGATGASSLSGGTTGAAGSLGVVSGAAGAASALSGLNGLVAGVLTGGTFTYNGVNYPNIGELLNALETYSDVRTLSTPEILATDGVKAKITIGEDVPFITGQSQTVGGNVMTMIQRQNVGITLELTPHILSHNRVRLDVKQTISALTNASQVIGTIAVGPTTTKRSAKTNLTISSGQTVVIGGLISKETSINDQGIPFLSDIPILGYLFSNTNHEKKRDDLLIFLTPYVIRSAQDLAVVKHDAPEALKKFASNNKLLQKLLLDRKTTSTASDQFLNTVDVPGDPGAPE
ncbi:MAG: type II secretion system protein GspD [Leptospirillia bacterium]